jgi:putative PEP-CTERM system TPR-repeat lipoprotein
LLVFSLTTGCKAKTKEELFKEGLDLIKEQNYKGAIVLFSNAIEKDKNFFEARFELAKAYGATGKFEKAEKELLKVARQDPSNSHIHKELSSLYISTNQPDKAIEEAEKYLKENPDDYETLESIAYGYAQKEEYSKAEEYFLKVLEADPKKISSKIGLAKIYMAREKHADVRAILQEIIQQDNKNSQAYYILASLEESSGNTENALSAYQQINKLNPNDFNALFRRGLLHINNKEYADAEKIAHDIIQKFPKRSEGYRLKGLVHFHKNQFGEAITALQQSIRLGPSIGAYYFLGLSHYRAGEYEQAISQFQKVLDFNPSFLQSRLMLSIVYLQLGRIDDAVTEAKRIIQQNDNIALAHNVLGSAYMAQGLYDEAMKEYDIALDIDPNLIDIHLKKGLFTLGQGRVEKAETDLKTAVELSPEVLNTRLVLVSYYMKKKEYEKAIKTLKEGIQGNAKDAILYSNIAIALFAQKKTDNALDYLQKAKETAPDYFTPYFHRANYFTIKGAYDQALNEYSAVLERNSQNIKALIGTASIYMLQAKEAEAFVYYKKAEETNHPTGFIPLTQYFLRKKEVDKALGVLDNTIQKNPRNTSALELKGRIYLSQKKYKETIKIYEALDEIDHKKGFPLLVNTYLASQDYKTALKKVKKELKLNPKRYYLMGEISKIYLLMGDTYNAIENANQIIQQRPDSAQGYNVLAFIYQTQNDLDSAINSLLKGLKVDSKNIQTKMMLSGLYIRKKEYNLALKELDEITTSNPRYIPALFAQGTAYDLMNKKKEAINKYLEVLNKVENYTPALNNLSYLYLQGYGSKEEALRLSLRAYSLQPSNGGVIDTLGYALLKNGRTDEAIKMLEGAVTLLPANPSVHYHLALAYKEDGNRSKAQKHLETALSKNNFPEAKSARKLLKEIQAQ